jgi:peptide/nickel transport system permease protein
MTMTDAPPVTLPDYRPQSILRRLWDSDSRRRYFRSAVGMLSLAVVLLFVVVALVGPFLTMDPNRADVLSILQPPDAQHWFGTDQLGRDVFARVVDGVQVSLLVSVVATVIAVFIGMIVGTLSAFRGGFADDMVSRFVDILITFPTLLLGIVIAVVMGPSIVSIIVALSISQIPLYARLFRAGVLTAKNTEYVMGATALGLRPIRILARHIVPNTIVPVLVVAASHVGRLAISEASLSYLGAGIQQPNASLGNMISEGQPYLQVNWWLPVIPGAVLMVLSVAFSFMGDALRDAFDVRESSVVQASAA